MGTFGHGLAIATLLAMAAAVWFTGCSSGSVRDVTGNLAATPSPLEFGVVAVDQRAEREVELRNRGAAPLRITAIVAEGEMPPAFVLPDPPARPIPVSGRASISFAFQPDAERVYDGRVVVHTDSADEPFLTIDLAGEGARPAVSCTERLDFGRIVLNTDKVLRITCVNTGGVPAPLRLAGKDGDDPGLFEVGLNLVADPTEIPAGQSQLVEVRYTAQHLGRASARALLEVEGANDPMHAVELTGEGFASDLVALPNCIHFGAVSPGTVAEREVTVYNGGNRVVTFEAPRILDSSGVFGVTRTEVEGVETELVQLGEGEQAKLTVAFAPPAIGSFAGDLQIRSDDPTHPRINICLSGQGGGADILVHPELIDFGTVALGMRARASVTIRNGGTPDGGPLQISGVEVGEPGTFTVRPPQVTVLDAGSGVAVVEVEFHPQDIGTFYDTLIIHSNDGDTPAYEVPLAGRARELPPCDYVVEPPNLRFGSIQRGSVATLSASLRNVGDDECVFASVALAAGTDDVFRQPEGAIGVASVAPGAALSVPVQLDASRVGTFSGSVHFYVSSPANPQASIPITAQVIDGCLVATPGAVDFGTQRISCPRQSRSVRLTNSCASSVQITSASLGAGTMTPGEILLGATPVVPVSVAPGGSVTFTVTYDAVDEGHDSVPLHFTSSAHDLSVPIHGSGTASDTRTDVFTQAERSAVDVLFVVDNSGSMMEEQEAVGEAFDEFIQYAVTQSIDYHIGVTTTGITASGGGWSACPGGVDGAEAGRLFPANGERPRWITPSTPNAMDVFRENVRVGVCHWWEEGLEAAYRALSSPLVDSRSAPNTPFSDDGNLGFYRPEARLSVIVVTDEDDHSDKPPSFYSDFFRNLKGAENAHKVTFNGVLGDGCNTAYGEGVRYRQVIEATGGSWESICTTDWGRSLINLAQTSFGFKLRFPLSGRPQGGVTVRVDGRAVTVGWHYDAATNEVVFTESTAPAPGARLEVTYTPACGS